MRDNLPQPSPPSSDQPPTPPLPPGPLARSTQTTGVEVSYSGTSSTIQSQSYKYAISEQTGHMHMVNIQLNKTLNWQKGLVSELQIMNRSCMSFTCMTPFKCQFVIHRETITMIMACRISYLAILKQVPCTCALMQFV